MEPYCCNIECDRPAEYLILTVRRGAESMAGPDPYADDTHACSDHVGDLLGHQPGARDPEDIYWHVAPISWATAEVG
jgi:hypothetical protein